MRATLRRLTLLKAFSRLRATQGFRRDMPLHGDDVHDRPDTGAGVYSCSIGT